MCGITGIYAFDGEHNQKLNHIERATDALTKRGPDRRGIFQYKAVAIGHRRLSIIDTSDRAVQPMADTSGRYIIAYNGEVYNYKSLRKSLVQAGFHFQSESDTEVVLNLFIQKGLDFLSELNGFFALAIYDKEKNELLIARDRYGIKPLLYAHENNQFLFASEFKSLFKYDINKELDKAILWKYLQLNYVPGPASMIQGVHKVKPGSGIIINEKGLHHFDYYQDLDSRHTVQEFKGSYEDAQLALYDAMEQAVCDRLVADVPLGTFLSGGIDSSVITALAAKHTNNLNTFSIGYADEPFFDETTYAELVAKKYKTNHTTFRLTNKDLFDGLYAALNYMDEPFADSSALAVNILCQHTKREVTVALSGDGADELFSGYNKHLGEFRMRNAGTLERSVGALKPLWQVLPQSRNNPITNRVRQLDRFATSIQLNEKERYWNLATFVQEYEARKMLSPDFIDNWTEQIYDHRKEKLLSVLSVGGSFNEVLDSDLRIVLPYDMLTKVDLMSMNNSLEVRVPFLDHRVVKLARSLPVKFKINKSQKKRILQDTFRGILPEELYNRPKHGFEVPLLKWLQKDLNSLIKNDLLKPEFLREQGIFNEKEVTALTKRLHSANPGDSHARVWGLLVFQWWWRKYFN